MSKMRAWVLKGKENMQLEKRAIPKPKANEALIRIKAVGICGSDVHYYREGKIGSYIVNDPLVLGHECSGEVVAVGNDVTNVKIGDKVVLEPGIACGKCHYCKSGRYNLCQKMAFMATPPFDGCLSEYMVWSEDLLFKMPSEMSYEEGALVEPFVVTLQAIRESGIGFSDSAVVVGTGTIGQLMVQTLKTIGAGTIIAIGRNPLKLELAKRMGATHVVNSTTEDAAARVRELTDGLGAMYGYEAVGSEQTFYQMVDYVRDGATVTFLGLLTEDSTPMPMVSSIIKNLKFATVIRYTNVFAEALTMLKYKRAEILPILTHKFPFEKAIDAFNEAINNKKDAIKVMINL